MGPIAFAAFDRPDAEISIEPVYYGVSSDIMAFAMTYHQHGAQKHPVEGWIEELIEHPSNVLGRLDASRPSSSPPIRCRSTPEGLGQWPRR